MRAVAAEIEPEKITIEQAVAQALEKNLASLAEKQNLAIAEARTVPARLGPNPVLTLSGDHLDLLGTYSSSNAACPAEYGARTDFVIERGGKRCPRIEVASAANEVARPPFLNSVRSLVLEVEISFVNALLAKSNVALATDSLKTLNDVAEINKARVRSGDLANRARGHRAFVDGRYDTRRSATRLR
jgi:outer membrane protein, heavy metal efflux system